MAVLGGCALPPKELPKVLPLVTKVSPFLPFGHQGLSLGPQGLSFVPLGLPFGHQGLPFVPLGLPFGHLGLSHLGSTFSHQCPHHTPTKLTSDPGTDARSDRPYLYFSQAARRQPKVGTDQATNVPV